MRDVFSTYHPIVNFSFFLAALGFSMSFMHPVCLGISLVCALCYSGYLLRGKALRFNLIYMLPLLILTVTLNPLFNHQGATILMYLRSGNPLTLESILFGISAAVMLITVITWFSCFNKIITSDKFVYLFGRIIPALSLVLSMTMRFVPHFKAQMRRISLAQRYIGKDVSN
ncbi:MAG: energy-coupling factor transporter transmembrane protein EcfT, partial [Defluviitaleaceae bacterium]|nr:energy-coupling factor transporter transmembrane protein EcfT [Defluviitaleaceae bacterium]